MPYRAMMWTILTIGLALLAVGLWVRAVSPMLQVATSLPEAAARSAVTTAATNAAALHQATQPPEKALAALVRGVLVLSFLLICLLLLVGFAATVREWMRDSSAPHRHWWRRDQRTAYVDAWRIAGQRLKVDDDTTSPPPADKPPEP